MFYLVRGRESMEQVAKMRLIISRFLLYLAPCISGTESSREI